MTNPCVACPAENKKCLKTKATETPINLADDKVNNDITSAIIPTCLHHRLRDQIIASEASRERSKRKRSKPMNEIVTQHSGFLV